MLNHIPVAACAACLFLPIVHAHAQSAPSSAELGADLGEVVVTATRSPQPADRALEPLIVVDRVALENSLALDVGDVLRFDAGLDIGRSGGPGQPLSLFIRGANSDQSIIMIDGVRINAGTIGGAPLQNLAPELFERIEVVEGPRSAIYGTDAIGGVVNLITRTAGPSGSDAMLSYGRYGTAEAAVDGHYAEGDTSVRADFNGQRSGGFPTFAADGLDSSYQNLSGIVTAATQIAAVDLGAFYWLSTGTSRYAEANYNDDFTAFASFTPLAERFSNTAFAVHAAGDVTDRWHARLSLSRIVDDLRQEQLTDFDHTSRNTLDFQNDVNVDVAPVNQRLTLGAILQDERTQSSSFGTGYATGTHTDTFYLQDQLETGPHRLLLAGGYYHHPAFGNHETWNAEYGYALTTDTLLIASAGTAFRAPSATDRFGFGGNPDLLPESSRSFEVGFKTRWGDSQHLSLAAFQDTIEDLIETVFDPANLVYGYQNENVDRARIRGIEAGWDVRTDAWSAQARVSVQDPRNLSADATDTQLLRRTKHSFSLMASRHIGRADVGVDLLDSGARRDFGVVDGTPVSDGGYLLAAVHARAALTPDWSVALRLDNALNRHYQLANGYNTAGRGATLSTRYSFH